MHNLSKLLLSLLHWIITYDMWLWVNLCICFLLIQTPNWGLGSVSEECVAIYPKNMHQVG